jgi:hypothetical protein
MDSETIVGVGKSVIETYRSTGTVSQHPVKYDGPLGNPSSPINVLDSGLRQSVSYTVGENRVVVLRCTRGQGEGGGATAGVTVDRLPQISAVDTKHRADICPGAAGHQP